MKCLKKTIKIIFKILIALVIILLLSIVIIFGLENRDVRYLKISEANFSTNSYLIKNVNLISMTKDTVLSNRQVLIENGIITRIDSIPPIVNFDIIDGSNKYLTPGLIDMHVHVWDKHELGLYLATGVTTIRNMWGMPAHLRLKKELIDSELLGPIFYTATPKLTGPDDAGPDKKQIQTPKEAKSLITKYKKDGYDVVKTYAGMPEDIFEVIREQAKIEGLNIASHPSQLVDYSYHFQPEFETIEHTEDIIQTALRFKVDSLGLNSIIKLYKENNKSHTPTISIFQNIIDILQQEQSILENEETSYVNSGFIKVGSINDLNRWTSEKSHNIEVIDRIKNQHQDHLKIVKLLNDHGVNIVCGSDGGIMFAAPGFSTHEELAYYVEAGLTNYEALATATVNATKVSPLYENLGTIEKGKTANLILTKNNPLDDITTLKTPNTVWIKGRMVDKANIELFKDKAKNRKTGAASILRLLESFIR